MSDPEKSLDLKKTVTYCIEDNSVRIPSQLMSTCAPLTVIEAICIAIADSDPENNPCGLFCHPLSEIDTRLVFEANVMCHQDSLACLIEELFISCNYPRHIRVETEGTMALTLPLAEQVKRHLLLRNQGGYMDEAKPPSSWVWQCDSSTPPEASAIESYKAAGGEIIFVKA